MHRPPSPRPNKRAICLSRIAEQRTRPVDVREALPRLSQWELAADPER